MRKIFKEKLEDMEARIQFLEDELRKVERALQKLVEWKFHLIEERRQENEI